MMYRKTLPKRPPVVPRNGGSTGHHYSETSLCTTHV